MRGHAFSLSFATCFLVASFAAAEDRGQTRLKREAFDRDPGWEGVNNFVAPTNPPIVRQDFGYSATNMAGGRKGEVGGLVQRSAKPASYALKIEPKTLDDLLTASGSFAITETQPGAGLFFGFFNSNQPGGSGRPIGSLGLDFDFEGEGGRLAVRLISEDNTSCGTFITPYVPGKFRPTPLKKDGTRYDWELKYDPNAAAGRGEFTFELNSESHTSQDYGPLSDVAQTEALARFPNTKIFRVALPEGFRAHATTFDRFGLMNMMKAGGSAKIYFDDLRVNDTRFNFDSDPSWLGVGNHETYEEQEQVGAHHFGYSADTSFAGGEPGEIGGVMWRSGEFGYYADQVGPLDLTHKLTARGKVQLVTAGPDSDVFLGWFNSVSKERGSAENKDFVGVHVGGPTRVGHYFIPIFASSGGTIRKVDEGPVLRPRHVFEWSLTYDPEANSGNGAMHVALGDESVTLLLKPGDKAENAHLDRFGLCTTTTGGQMVKLFLDDVDYRK